MVLASDLSFAEAGFSTGFNDAAETYRQAADATVSNSLSVVMEASRNPGPSGDLSLTAAQQGQLPKEPWELVEWDRAFYAELSAPAGNSGEGGYALAPLADTFFLHSLPTATKTIFIDFDGNTTVGTHWNTAHSVDRIVSPAYDPDGNGASFTNSELLRIQRIWQRIAADFAPFDVNVTTQDPGEAALVKSGAGDTAWGIRAVVTQDNFSLSGAGGIAYPDSFNWGYQSFGATDTPCFIFNTSEIGVAGAVSHEVGHTLGLSHDGTTASNPVQPNAVYYDGHGTGETGWGPIMGTGYYKNVTTWDTGQYYGANNIGTSANYGKGVSDLAVITGYNGFGFRPDDHGNTIETASVVSSQGSSGSVGFINVSAEGLIEQAADVDFIRFETGGGVVNLTIDPYISEMWVAGGGDLYSRTIEGTYFNGANWQLNQGANLDVEARLYNSAGGLLAISDPAGLRAAFTNLSLAAGIYYVRVDGVGFGNPSSSISPGGYTEYGSLGHYRLSGTVVSTAEQIVAVAVSADKLEGDSGTTAFQFAVNLTEAQTFPISVDWAVEGSGAFPADGADFGGRLPTGTVTIPAGQTSVSVNVEVSGDAHLERDETFTFSLSNPSAGEVAASAVGTIRNDERIPILFVDDDQGASLESHFENALIANDFYFDTWNVAASELPTFSDLAQYDAVVWNTGFNYTSATAGLSSAEQTAIQAYLESGGRLFLSGQDILYNGVSPGFRQDFLKIASFANDAVAVSHTEIGVTGNPIGDGLALSLIAPAGYASLYVDAVSPVADADGVLLLTSGTSHPYSAVSFRGDYSLGEFGVVFFAVPFEAISTSAAAPNNQYTVMKRVIDFLLPASPVNSAPVIDVDLPAVSGSEGQILTNWGTWSDPDGPANTITLSASSGEVTANSDGTWYWELPVSNEVVPTEVVITADDGAGGVTTASFTYTASNLAPVLGVESPHIIGNVLTELSVSGTWVDVPADDVDLTASLGSVAVHADGTWRWTYAAVSKLTNTVVTITASDGVDSSTIQFDVTANVHISNSQIYYKNSAFSAGGSDVVAALDPAKVLARPSIASQTLSYASIVNTTRGLNGVVFDVGGLVASSLSASDFSFRMSPTGLFNESENPPSSWAGAPSPTAIFVSPGTAATPARVRLEWADNAISNRWLQIALAANASTGLSSPEVFYIGHLQGELNGHLLAGAYFVNNADLAMIAPIGGGATIITNDRDVDKNRFVLNSDGVAVRDAVVAGLKLRNISIPPSGSADEGIGVFTDRVFATTINSVSSVFVAAPSIVSTVRPVGRRVDVDEATARLLSDADSERVAQALEVGSQDVKQVSTKQIEARLMMSASSVWVSWSLSELEVDDAYFAAMLPVVCSFP